MSKFKGDEMIGEIKDGQAVQQQGWDRGVSFQDAYKKIREKLTSKSAENTYFSKSPERRARLAILFIALRNGARLGESKDAYNKFIETKKHVVEVRVEKRGYAYPMDEQHHRLKGKGTLIKPFFRKMFIPDEVSDTLPAYHRTKNNLSNFCKVTLGYNAHSLRYAFVGYMSSQGVSPQEIAKMTGHATLNQILGYTQQKQADYILEHLVI